MKNKNNDKSPIYKGEFLMQRYGDKNIARTMMRFHAKDGATKEIEKTKYNKYKRTFTPEQAAIIIKYLG